MLFLSLSSVYFTAIDSSSFSVSSCDLLFCSLVLIKFLSNTDVSSFLFLFSSTFSWSSLNKTCIPSAWDGVKTCAWDSPSTIVDLILKSFYVLFYRLYSTLLSNYSLLSCFYLSSLAAKISTVVFTISLSLSFEFKCIF